MENHPIPQDVTGFQFKLIGDITVKQFAYLIAAAIGGWVLFSLPIFVFVKLPIAILWALSGIALAFLPVEGRPLDTMIINFVRALFNPNQYIYEKQGGELALVATPVRRVAHKNTMTNSAPKSADNLQAYLNQLPNAPKNKLDEKEMTYFKTLFVQPQQQEQKQSFHFPSFGGPHLKFTPPKPQPPQPVADAPAPQAPTQQQVQPAPGTDQSAQALQQQIQQAKQEEQIAQTPQQAQVAHEKTIHLEQEMNEILKQKQQLEQQLMALTQKMETQQKQQQAVTPQAQVVSKDEPRVRVVPKEMGVKVGVPFASEFPNIVTGIVKDPRGNILPNILVEIKDKEGNPVRAFKTNQLGQFRTATPLLNGTYTLEFEDPGGKNKFDIVQIEASGDIIMPIEVLSSDQREELRKELFG